MDIFNTQESKKKGPKKGPGLPNRQQFLSNILSVVLILLILSTVYSMISESQTKVEEISISELATDISKGLILIFLVGREVTGARVELVDPLLTVLKEPEGTLP